MLSNRHTDTQTHTHTQTHRPSTVILAAHARRGLMIRLQDCQGISVYLTKIFSRCLLSLYLTILLPEHSRIHWTVCLNQECHTHTHTHAHTHVHTHTHTHTHTHRHTHTHSTPHWAECQEHDFCRRYTTPRWHRKRRHLGCSAEWQEAVRG